MNPPSTNTEAFIQRLDIAPTASGPLDGLTFAVKDVIDVAGTVTGCGNPTWASLHGPAAAHAVVVEQLLGSGARCLGKTITDEFAFSLVGENHYYGTPLNPLAPDRVPGGSSAGSASVVASKAVDFALGTDTAGSVRVPAANCGIYGLRPTWGRISVAGVQPLAPSFDTVGVLAREIPVLQRVLKCLRPNEEPITPIRTILVLEDAWQVADLEVQSMLTTTIDKLKGAGFTVKMIRLAKFMQGELGVTTFAWKQLFSTSQWPEVWSTYGGWLEETKAEIGPKIAENFALVKTYDRTLIEEATRRCEDVRNQLQTFLDPATVFCIPTVPSPPPLRGKVDYNRTGTGYMARALCLASIAGVGRLPQITMPATASHGLPMGVSLVGAPDTDLALIAAAEKL
jgi:amidase